MNGTGSYSKSWVIRLIIINAVVYIIQIIAQDYQNIIMSYFGLIPANIIQFGFVWQLVTYLFLHGSPFHILFNMYALLIFGIPIEQNWGSKRFLFYYFFTGIGAGLVIFLINFIQGDQSLFVVTIGASGAVFGLLLAFGILYPDAILLVFFVIPLKAKYFVIIYGLLEFYFFIKPTMGDNVSHVGHLGGLFFGILYFLITRRRGLKFKSKKLSANLQKAKKSDHKIVTPKIDDKTFLMNILLKVKQGGFNALSDDEVQQVNYLHIMFQDSKKLCSDSVYNPDDNTCEGCDHVEACLLREIEKYQ